MIWEYRDRGIKRSHLWNSRCEFESQHFPTFNWLAVTIRMVRFWLALRLKFVFRILFIEKTIHLSWQENAHFQKSWEFGVKNAFMRPVTMSLNVFKYQKNKISTLKRRQHAETHHEAVIFYYLDSVHCILLCICIPWQVFIKHSICCVRDALSCTCETFLHTLNNSHLFLYLVLCLYFVFVFM